MLTAAQILLMIHLLAAGADTPVVPIAVDDLTVAPRILPMPPGMPGARLAPRHGHWVDQEAEEVGPGTWLPEPLDREYYRRLRACERLPDAFQVQLDKLVELHRIDGEGRVWATEARCLAQRLEDKTVVAGSWSGWQVALLSVASAVVAGGIVKLVQ